MSKASQTKLKYIKEYCKENYKQLIIRLNKKSDADVIEYLEQIGKGNKTEFITRLIREAIAAEAQK